MLAIERRDYILKTLRETGRGQVSELSKTLNVSRMTIHRDLDALAQEGFLEKVFGGAVLASEHRQPDQTGVCAMCGRLVTARTRVVLQTRTGEQIDACCPHCATLLLETRDDIVSGLAVDFIHGKMINLKTATFVVNPDIVVCCTPSVLCFADREEAQRFQVGFRGELATLRDAQKLTIQHMNLSR
jgi:hypothetical protein